MLIKPYGFFFLMILAFVFCGCHPGIREEPVAPAPLKQLRPGDHPLFMDHMDFQGLVESIDHSLIYYRRLPPEREFSYGHERYTAGHLIRSLETFRTAIDTSPSAKAVNELIRKRFRVYEAAGNQDGNVLFTGYFEPTYEGRLEQSHEYPYPLFSRPSDLLEIDLAAFSDQYKGHRRLMARVNDSTRRVVPYYTREEINAVTDFYARAEPVAWLKSRVDRFFLEIQGSGRIDLGDGTLLPVHYALSNGRAYRSVGKYLIDRNEISKEAMSMQAIRQWLEKNPHRIDEVLNYNQSFVFFKEEKDGPIGSLGVKVTAFRSIATDSGLFPRGSLCFIQAPLPDKAHMDMQKEWENRSFFVMNQDTGGAIKGPARADLFCGNGDYAAFTAGHMKHYGRLFFLVLKPDKQ